MSKLEDNETMINSVKDLNKFAEDKGVKAHGELLSKLIEHKELISFQIAKLLTEKAPAAYKALS